MFKQNSQAIQPGPPVDLVDQPDPQHHRRDPHGLCQDSQSVRISPHLQHESVCEAEVSE